MVVVPCAGAQIVPLQTSDNLVGDTVETTAGTVGDVTQSLPVRDLSTGLGGTVSTTEQTATDVLNSVTSGASTSGGSGSSSRDRADGTASPGKEFRSRFDRLPPRLERLLERIELGRNVRADLRRLQQALASLSAREQARVLRLLNAEISRLRADGVSAKERKRIERLIRAREAIAELGAPASTPAVADTSTRTRAAGSPPAGGVLGVSAAGRDASPGKAVPPTEAGSSGSAKTLDAGGFPLRILLAVGAVLLVILGGLALREEWPA